MSSVKNSEIIESLLFLKGDEGVGVEYYSIFMDISKKEAQEELDKFLDIYNQESRSLTIRKFGNIYKMLVKDDIYKGIKEKLSNKKLSRLSKASMETLAIIAYNQPISKQEIESIRGVSSDNIITNLMEKDLIFSDKVLDKIGKPKLYETTDYFLDVFGLASIDELPQLRENEEIEVDKIEDFLNNK